MLIEKPLPQEAYAQHVADLGGACAFCGMPEHLDILCGEHWDWVFAAFPYRKFHTLLVPRRHVVSLSELTREELAELGELVGQAESGYRGAGIVGGGSPLGDFVLFSWRLRVEPDPSKTSVAHLHLHAYPLRNGEHGVSLDAEAWNVEMGRLRGAARGS